MPRESLLLDAQALRSGVTSTSDVWSLERGAWAGMKRCPGRVGTLSGSSRPSFPFPGRCPNAGHRDRHALSPLHLARRDTAHTLSLADAARILSHRHGTLSQLNSRGASVDGDCGGRGAGAALSSSTAARAAVSASAERTASRTAGTREPSNQLASCIHRAYIVHPMSRGSARSEAHAGAGLEAHARTGIDGILRESG